MIGAIDPGEDLAYSLGKRGAIVIGGSACGRTLPEVMEEIRAVAALRPDVSHDLIKIKVAAAGDKEDPGSTEHLTDDQWDDVARRVVQHLGYGRCPYVVVRHTDAGHDHVHVEVLPISVDGRIVDKAFDRYALQAVLREIEQTEDLKKVIPSWEVEGHQKSWGDVRRAQAGGLRFHEDVALVIGREFDEATSWPDVLTRLSRHKFGLDNGEIAKPELRRSRTGLAVMLGKEGSPLSWVTGRSMAEYDEKFGVKYDEWIRGAEAEALAGRGGRAAEASRGDGSERSEATAGGGGRTAPAEGYASARGTAGEGGRGGDQGVGHGRGDPRDDPAGDRRPQPANGPGDGGEWHPGASGVAAGDEQLRDARVHALGRADRDGGHSDRPGVHVDVVVDGDAVANPLEGQASGPLPLEHRTEIEVLLARYGEARARSETLKTAINRVEVLRARLQRALTATADRDRASSDLDEALRPHTGSVARTRAQIDDVRRTTGGIRADDVLKRTLGTHTLSVRMALERLMQAEEAYLRPTERKTFERELATEEAAIARLRQAQGPALRELQQQIREVWARLSVNEQKSLPESAVAQVQDLVAQTTKSRSLGGRGMGD